MKYIVMAALLMAGVATHAQEPLREQSLKTRTERLTPAQRADKLTESLGLTADQQTKVKVLLEEQEKSSSELREKYKGERDEASRKARVEAMKDSREQFKIKMKEILTPDQFTKWQSANENPRSEKLKSGATESRRLEQKALPQGN
nr:hypothetical protein [uncultured Flavobacterium sp.]